MGVSYCLPGAAIDEAGDRQIVWKEGPLARDFFLSGAAFVSCKLFPSAGKTKGQHAAHNMQHATPALGARHSKCDPLDAVFLLFGTQAQDFDVCHVERGIPRISYTYWMDGSPERRSSVCPFRLQLPCAGA